MNESKRQKKKSLRTEFSIAKQRSNKTELLRTENDRYFLQKSSV